MILCATFCFVFFFFFGFLCERQSVGRVLM
uniref:Uncharacterized protein n=1 Tax=Rhizophora mucronata TaxID=61149 RepID=A0A2P2L393_RHIMU